MVFPLSWLIQPAFDRRTILWNELGWLEQRKCECLPLVDNFVFNLLYSVKTADIALCVLSPDEDTGSWDVDRLPSDLRQLLDDKTLFLFNKMDLMKGEPAASGQGWRVSLTSGDGMADFVREFSKVLRER